MKNFILSLSEKIRARADEYKNKAFLEAAMAACALVTTADKVGSFSERMKLDQFLETINKLKIYDPHIAVDLFNEFVDQLNEDKADSRAKAMQRIKDIAEKKEDAQIILEICVAISLADGTLSNEEKTELAFISETLDVERPDILDRFSD